MGMIKTLLLIASAAVGGIYLTSDEGKSARKALQEKKSSFEPIIKSLLDEGQKILEGSSNINSDEIKANIKMLVSESKKTLLEIDFDEALEVVKKAIKVASKSIRDAGSIDRKAKITRIKKNN